MDVSSQAACALDTVFITTPRIDSEGTGTFVCMPHVKLTLDSMLNLHLDYYILPMHCKSLHIVYAL